MVKRIIEAIGNRATALLVEEAVASLQPQADETALKETIKQLIEQGAHGQACYLIIYLFKNHPKGEQIDSELEQLMSSIHALTEHDSTVMEIIEALPLPFLEAFYGKLFAQNKNNIEHTLIFKLFEDLKHALKNSDHHPHQDIIKRQLVLKKLTGQIIETQAPLNKEQMKTITWCLPLDTLIDLHTSLSQQHRQLSLYQNTTLKKQLKQQIKEKQEAIAWQLASQLDGEDNETRYIKKMTGNPDLANSVALQFFEFFLSPTIYATQCIRVLNNKQLLDLHAPKFRTQLLQLCQKLLNSPGIEESLFIQLLTACKKCFNEGEITQVLASILRQGGQEGLGKIVHWSQQGDHFPELLNLILRGNYHVQNYKKALIQTLNEEQLGILIKLSIGHTYAALTETFNLNDVKPDEIMSLYKNQSHELAKTNHFVNTIQTFEILIDTLAGKIIHADPPLAQVQLISNYLKDLTATTHGFVINKIYDLLNEQPLSQYLLLQETTSWFFSQETLNDAETKLFDAFIIDNSLKLLNNPNISIEKCQQLLKQFPPAPLISLLMQTNNAYSSLHHEKTLFASIKALPSGAIYNALLQTANIPQQFHALLLDALDDQHLVDFLTTLKKNKQEDSFKDALYLQALERLSTRLQTQTVSNSSIHQLLTARFFQSNVALDVLKSASCMMTLCELNSYTPLYVTDVLWGSIGFDTAKEKELEQRIIKFLNNTTISDEALNVIALNLLIKFGEKQELETIFSNIYYASNGLSQKDISLPSGEDNFTRLKNTVFSFLSPQEVYDEQSFYEKLRLQQSDVAIKNTLNAEIARKVSISNNPSLAAYYFSFIKNIEYINASDWNDEEIIDLLLHSNTESYLKNWENAKKLISLKYESFDEKKSFLKKLIVKAGQDSSDIICGLATQKNIADFILSFDNHLELLTELSPKEIAFLSRYLPKENQDNVPIIYTWIETLCQHQTIKPSDVPNILQNHFNFDGDKESQQLEALYSLPFFNEPSKLSTLFTSVKLDAPNATKHLICLLNVTQKLNCDEQKVVLSKLLKYTFDDDEIAIFLPILNQIVMSIDDLSAQHFSDMEMIKNLISQLTQYYGKKISNNDFTFTAEIEQTLSNLLIYLHDKDSNWVRNLASSEALCHFLMIYIKHNVDITPANLNKNLLFKLISEHDILSEHLHETLKNNKYYIRFAKELLTNSQFNLNTDLINNLFNSLPLDTQQQIAVHLLENDQVSSSNLETILTATRALSPQKLYEFYKKSKTPLLYVDIILNHPTAHKNLSDIQLSSLINKLTGDDQIFRVLNSQASIQAKNKIVERLLAYLPQNEASVKKWLDKTITSSHTLALLLNHLPNSNNYAVIIEKIINKKEFSSRSKYQSLLDNYFAHPLEDCVILDNTLLYFSLYKNFSSPQKSGMVKPSLFKYLSSQDKNSCLRIHHKQTQEIDQLKALYAPFTEHPNTQEEALVSARWLVQIPLLQALLTIINDFQNGKEQLKEHISKSSLYNTYESLFQQQDCTPDISIRLYNEIYADLTDYINQTQSHDDLNENLLLIKDFVLNFENKIHLIKNFSPQEIYYLIKPESPFSKLGPGGNCSQIRSANHKKALLFAQENQTNTSRHHNQKNKTPAMFLAEYVSSIAKQELHESTLQLIMADLFKSAMVHHLPQASRQRVVQQISSEQFEKSFNEINHKIPMLENCHEALISALINAESLPVMAMNLMEKFEFSDLNILANNARLANAAYLADFIETLIKTYTLKDNPKQLINELFTANYNGFFMSDWIHKDIEKFIAYSSHLHSLKNILFESRFSFNKEHRNKRFFSSIESLNCLNEISIDTIIRTFNSYLEFVSSHPSHDLFFQLKDNLIKILNQRAPFEQDALINGLEPDLLEHIVETSVDSLNSPTKETARLANDCINVVLDIALRKQEKHAPLIAYIKKNLDQQNAMNYAFSIKAIKTDILNKEDEEKPLDEHTFDGIWIQRLLMDPMGFIELNPDDILALTERYRILSRILKKDEFDSWVDGTQEQLDYNKTQLTITEQKLTAFQMSLNKLAFKDQSQSHYVSDISILEKRKLEILKKIAFIENKKQQILYFKADESIQEMFVQLQRNIAQYKQYAAGHMDSIDTTKPISTSEAERIANSAEKLLSKFQAQILSHAKTGMYADFMQSIYDKFLSNTGDLSKDFNSFWRYVCQATKQHDNLTRQLLSKIPLPGPDTKIYNENGQRIGLIDTHHQVIIPNTSLPLLSLPSSQIGARLYNSNAEYIGNLDCQSKISQHNNFLTETSANIMRFVAIDKLKLLPNFQTLIKDVLSENQFYDLFYSLSFLVMFDDEVSDSDEKFSWISAQFLSYFKNHTPLITTESAFTLVENFELEAIYALIKHYKNSSDYMELLVELINCDNHRETINQDPHQFFKLLGRKKLPLDDLERLYTHCINKEFKQIILIHILNNNDFTHQQGKVTVFERINQKVDEQNSRLLLATASCDLSLINSDIIKELQAEPAVELCLSLNTYAAASQEQFDCLLNKAPDKSAVIQHFLTHNQSLPYFIQGFLKFHAHSPETLWSVVQKIQPEVRAALLKKLLSNQDVVQQVIQSMTSLLEDPPEAQKILSCMTKKADTFIDLFSSREVLSAIQLYTEEVNTSAHYLALLTYLVKSKLPPIIEQDANNSLYPPLNINEIKNILFLQDDLKFSSLHVEPLLTPYHYEQLVTHSAHVNDPSLFYKNGRFSINSATQSVEQNLLTHTKAEGVMSRIASGYNDFIANFSWSDWLNKGKNLLPLRWDNMSDDEQWDELTAKALEHLHEKPIDYFKRVTGSVKSIDLYLFNSKEMKSETIQLIHNYMDYYKKNLNDISDLHSTAYLMTNPEVKAPIREAIFNTLKIKPSLYLNDSLLCQQLFLYEQESLIKQFGDRGDYQSVISLCDNLLLKAPAHPMLIEAKRNAQLEKDLSEINSTFGFRKWYHRVRTYGWTWTWPWYGLFKPNEPNYVVKCEDIPANITPLERVTYKITKEGLPHREEAVLKKLSNYLPGCDLSTIKETMEIIKAFQPLSDTSKEMESDIRARIEEIYRDLTSRCTKDFSNPINKIVLNNSFLFMENRSELISALCQCDDKAARLNALLDTMSEERALMNKEFPILKRLFTPEARDIFNQMLTQLKPEGLSHQAEIKPHTTQLKTKSLLDDESILLIQVPSY